MKKTILCALVALLPTSLLAGEQITIRARFIESLKNTPIPHDLGSLNKVKGVNVVTAPRATTKPGREAKIEVIRDFGVGDLHPLPYRSVPTGVILTVTPYLNNEQIAYAATLTVREFTRRDPKEPTANGRKNLAEFTSLELFFSGKSKSGERVWFAFALPRDGRKCAVCLELTRKDA